MGEINLMPRDLIFLLKWPIRKIVVIAVLSSIAGSLGISAAYEKMIIDNKRIISKFDTDLSDLSRRKDEMSVIINGMEKIPDRKAEIDKIARVLKEYDTERILWSGLIGEISRNCHRDLWVDVMEVSERRTKDKDSTGQKSLVLMLDGKAIDRKKIAHFLQFMESSRNFENIELMKVESASHEDKRYYRFEIVCHVVR
ncbi:MAG: PilN domain-containing protein [Candidatus Krumholzibacteriota bacterium]|nr:PilN domain-containing protein [Candidatus Krumholzibacteriota bacterium]